MIRILQLTLPILQKAVPFGLLFALIISFITRKKTIRFFLFYFYLFVLSYITIFSRTPRPIQIDLMPFSTLSVLPDNLVYYFENMALFMPLGFFLALLTKRKSREIIFIGFLVSLCIEITQVVFSLGYGQMDDLIANTLGTAIGLLFTRFVKH